ncbi:1943_t:CDS:2, partial [Acaulospora colombiana]
MSDPQPEPSTSRTPVTAEPEAAKPPEQPVPAAHEPSTAANSDKATRNTDTNGDEELRRLERPPETQKIENPEWGLKEIVWPPEPWENEPQRAVKIVTQNANGPCSFIAICKAPSLRPDSYGQSASYEYLSALVGDYLVNTALEIDIDAVFSILPKT